MSENPLAHLVELARQIISEEWKHFVAPSLPRPLRNVDGNVVPVMNAKPAFNRSDPKAFFAFRNQAYIALGNLGHPAIDAGQQAGYARQEAEQRVRELVASVTAVLKWESTRGVTCPDIEFFDEVDGQTVDPAGMAEEHLDTLVSRLFRAINEVELMIPATSRSITGVASDGRGDETLETSSDEGDAIEPDSREPPTLDDGKTEHDPIEDALSGLSLKQYLFLKDRSYFTSFDTFRQQDDCWQKDDVPDTTIKKALERLSTKLSDINAPITVTVSDARVKLESLRQPKDR